MKRSLRILIAMLAVFGLFASACSASDDAADTAKETAEDIKEDVAEAKEDAEEAKEDAKEDAAEAAGDSEVDDAALVFDIGGRGDLSFNDSAAVGIERVKAELGIDFTEASPNEDGSNRPELLQLGADSSEIVIAVGYLFESDVVVAAEQNPEVYFAVVDSAMVTDGPDGTKVPYADNIAGLVFAEHEGSFLVGAAAALKSETGKVGFIGGVKGMGLIEKFEAGFVAGALEVNPDIEIITQYVSEVPDFSGFTSPDQGKSIATTMYEEGADVIYHAAGPTGNGLFTAAKEYSEDEGSKVWAIGVDSDQYETVAKVDPSLQEYILTSMVKRVDVSVFEAVKAAQAGEFTPGTITYDITVDGVGYSTSGGFVDDIVDKLEDYKAKIIAGEIVVPSVPS